MTTSGISQFIREQVALCVALEPDQIDVDAPLVERIGLIGDDFTEIDYRIREKYGVETSDADYLKAMSISDWAKIISQKVQQLK